MRLQSLLKFLICIASIDAIAKSSPLSLAPSKHSQCLAAQSAMREEPTNSPYWNYWIQCYHAANLPPHGKWLHFAGGGVISEILYATNADNIDLVDAAPAYPMHESALEYKLMENILLDSGGFVPFVYIEHLQGLLGSLYFDLKRMQVGDEIVKPLEMDIRALIKGKNTEHITFNSQSNSYTFKFQWAYPGEKPALRTITLYPRRCLPQADLIPFDGEKYVGIFCKGALSIPKHYKEIISPYLYRLIKKTWIIIDGLDSNGVSHSLEEAFPNLRMESILEGKNLPPNITESRINLFNLIKLTIKEYLAAFGYGWNLRYLSFENPSSESNHSSLDAAA